MRQQAKVCVPRGRRPYAFSLSAAALLALGPAALGPSASARISPTMSDLRPLVAPSLMPLTRDQAERRNAGIGIAAGVGPAATPFLSAAYSDSAATRALECLATAVYYEAASEPLDTQRAVAQVVLNRMRHGNYPNSICGVVFEGSSRRTGCQFTFTCDGALQRRRPDAAGWRTATRIAGQALAGYVHAPVGLATHFHADWVVPYWSTSLAKVAKIGTTIFYRWHGSASHPSAFNSRYSGVEPSSLAAASVGAGTDAHALEPMPQIAAIPVSYSDEVEAVAKVDDFGLLDHVAPRSESDPMEARNPMLAEAVVAASKAGGAPGPTTR